MKNALKNCVMFFGAAIVGVIAIFTFFGVILPVPQAHAYAVGSVPSNTIGSGYDFGSSLQNLVSPFTGFINSLKFNKTTTINVSGMNNSVSNSVSSLPTVNAVSVLENTIQNILSQWVSQFDNWLYGVTGVQLSGILVAILSVFAWALGLAQQIVKWLLGLFH